MITGWMVRNTPSQVDVAADIHGYAASVLMFALVMRMVIGFAGSQNDTFSALLPRQKELNGMKEMLLFYISLGRAQLPKWYAHNPLWKSIYLIIYLLLILMVISGAVMPDRDILFGWYLPALHRDLAGVIFWLMLLHLISVVMHDYRGNTTDTSSIINGYRHFHIEKKLPVETPTQTTTSIRLDEIGK